MHWGHQWLSRMCCLHNLWRFHKDYHQWPSQTCCPHICDKSSKMFSSMLSAVLDYLYLQMMTIMNVLYTQFVTNPQCCHQCFQQWWIIPAFKWWHSWCVVHMISSTWRFGSKALAVCSRGHGFKSKSQSLVHKCVCSEVSGNHNLSCGVCASSDVLLRESVLGKPNIQ